MDLVAYGNKYYTVSYSEGNGAFHIVIISLIKSTDLEEELKYKTHQYVQNNNPSLEMGDWNKCLNSFKHNND